MYTFNASTFVDARKIGRGDTVIVMDANSGAIRHGVVKSLRHNGDQVVFRIRTAGARGMVDAVTGYTDAVILVS